ncbi:hypothetical protein AOLI_G00283660 [Acnodon oligacanthus]
MKEEEERDGGQRLLGWTDRACVAWEGLSLMRPHLPPRLFSWLAAGPCLAPAGKTDIQDTQAQTHSVLDPAGQLEAFKASSGEGGEQKWPTCSGCCLSEPSNGGTPGSDEASSLHNPPECISAQLSSPHHNVNKETFLYAHKHC